MRQVGSVEVRKSIYVRAQVGRLSINQLYTSGCRGRPVCLPPQSRRRPVCLPTNFGSRGRPMCLPTKDTVFFQKGEHMGSPLLPGCRGRPCVCPLEGQKSKIGVLGLKRSAHRQTDIRFLDSRGRPVCLPTKDTLCFSKGRTWVRPLLQVVGQTCVSAH